MLYKNKTIGLIAFVCLTVCFFNLMTSQDQASQQIKFHQNNVHMTTKTIHAFIKGHLQTSTQTDAVDAACLAKQSTPCLDAVAVLVKTMNASDIVVYDKYLQTQFDEFQKFLATDPNPVTRKWQNLEKYINSNFSLDKLTGAFWQCEDKTIVTCGLANK